MNLTVLLIAAYLPLPLILFMIVRSGSFGKGSVGTLLKLFFLGLLAAVPAFLMEAGCLLALEVLFRILPESAFGGNHLPAAAILRYVVAVALIEEIWKHFILRVSTWKQMMMETVADGIAASAVVGTGFAAVLFGAWQAAFRVVPADMGVLRDGMPDFLHAGAVTAFLFAVTYIFSHFGFSGLMGALYGIAKRSEQKEHGRRAGFMLFLSCLLSVAVHGLCAVLIGYGIASESFWWFAVGFAAQVLLALLMASALSHAADDALTAREQARAEGEDPNAPVDFADSEDFADFAESGGSADYEGYGEPVSGGHAFSMPVVGPDGEEGGSSAFPSAGLQGEGAAPSASAGNGFEEAGTEEVEDPAGLADAESGYES